MSWCWLLTQKEGIALGQQSSEVEHVEASLLVLQYGEQILALRPAGAGGMLGCSFGKLLCGEQHTSKSLRLALEIPAPACPIVSSRSVTLNQLLGLTLPDGAKKTVHTSLGMAASI